MKNTMTSRQRVHAAVNHQSPDRVPIDLGGLRASGIHVRCYEALKKRIGINSPTKVFDRIQLLAEVETSVIDYYDLDVLPLDVVYAPWQTMNAEAGQKMSLPTGQEVYFSPDTRIIIQENGDWYLCDETGTAFAQMPHDGYYFDYLRPTMAGQIDPNRYHPPMTISDEQLSAVEKLSNHLYTSTDKAILGWGGEISIIGLSALLTYCITQGSLDSWLAMLMVEKETTNEMMAKAVDSSIARLSLLYQAVGDRCEIWGVASDDAGTQRGELLSPDLFAEMIKPHYKRLCDWVHKNTTWKTMLHSCGSIRGYIGHWIEAGMDIINPVQISAANMEPASLMEEFGGRVVFWGGGCDTQHVLPNGTPEEIRDHVHKNLDAFQAEKGGFIFSQVHNVQSNVPTENVEAMLHAARGYRRAEPMTPHSSN